MKETDEIPGFKPEDYDPEPPGIEDMKLSDHERYWLHHHQKENEDGNALGEMMGADFDSFIVLGYNKEKVIEDRIVEHQSISGAFHVDKDDYDAVDRISMLLGHYAFKNLEVHKILKKALEWEQSLWDSENNPEPPEHKYHDREMRFHMNRYERILSEEGLKVHDEFMAACGDHKKRHDMRMRLVLSAIADQLNNNEAVEIDFFCNFTLGEKSNGDNVSGINIFLQDIPSTWDEADAKMGRFKELCKEYNVPCHMVWLED